MKRLLFLASLVFIISCDNPESETFVLTNPITDNAELQAIYDKDQSEREEGLDIGKIYFNDIERRKRVEELLDSNKVITGKDYYNAAMVFQHGDDTIASGMAVKMMTKALELDSTINKWLYAAAVDRDLMRKGKPQIYGTQFHKEGDGPWELYEIDTTVVNDEERKQFGVVSLKETKERVVHMNRAKSN